MDLTLPETGPLPRASVFAESQMSGSRQRKVCRESALGNGRPSAKPYLPRARPSAKNSSRQPDPLPRVRPSAKKGRWQKFIFAECRLSAKHGRRQTCDGRQTAFTCRLFCRGSEFGPRQRITLPSVVSVPSAKYIFFCFQFFSLGLLLYLKVHIKIWSFFLFY